MELASRSIAMDLYRKLAGISPKPIWKGEPVSGPTTSVGGKSLVRNVLDFIANEQKKGYVITVNSYGNSHNTSPVIVKLTFKP